MLFILYIHIFHTCYKDTLQLFFARWELFRRINFFHISATVHAKEIE
jgi:hypothetical protein